MSFDRRLEGADRLQPEPIGRHAGARELRPDTRPDRLARGTLACPRCDAPVQLAGVAAPADALACPFCAHAGAVRDFLSLATPTRPARVEVRVGGRYYARERTPVRSRELARPPDRE